MLSGAMGGGAPGGGGRPPPGGRGGGGGRRGGNGPGAIVPSRGGAGPPAQNAAQLARQLGGVAQAFSGGVSKSERMLVAGTDGSVEQVVQNMTEAVRQFGAAPGAKKMMDNERLAAEEAVRTGLYGVWRNPRSCHDFCGRIGPMSRCFCGHDYSVHAWGKGRREAGPSCSKCACRCFKYIPRRPEEVGEWWLPRRRGFDVNIWRAKCKCSHGHEEHDSSTLGCRCCGCTSYESAWLCVSCEGKWEDHESVWESEEERRHCGRAVGSAFMPLSSTPEIQSMVLDAPQNQRSHSLPHRPRPERSVRLMQERCPNYGGVGSGGPGRLAVGNGQGGGLEDAFPPARIAGSPGRLALGNGGGLEDAFPPARIAGNLESAGPSRRSTPGSGRPPRCGSRGSGAALGGFGSLEDAFPAARSDASGGRGSLEDAFPPARGGGR